MLTLLVQFELLVNSANVQPFELREFLCVDWFNWWRLQRLPENWLYDSRRRSLSVKKEGFFTSSGHLATVGQ